MSDKLADVISYSTSYLTGAVRDLTIAVDRATVELARLSRVLEADLPQTEELNRLNRAIEGELNRLSQALDTRADDGK
jgi:hypothetical protein